MNRLNIDGLIAVLGAICLLATPHLYGDDSVKRLQAVPALSNAAQPAGTSQSPQIVESRNLIPNWKSVCIGYKPALGDFERTIVRMEKMTKFHHYFPAMPF